MIKNKTYFDNGLVDIHYINIKNVADDNIKVYEDILYSAIVYIENNHINEIYMPIEYINFENSTEEIYNTEISEVLSTINSMISVLDKLEETKLNTNI